MAATGVGRVSGRLPTTAGGAEYAVVIAFLSLRSVSVIQVLASLPGGLPRSTRPAVDVALVLLFCGQTAVLAWRLRAHRRWTPSLALADVTVGCVVLLGQAAITAPNQRMDTWDAWGYAVTLSSAMAAGVGFRHRSQVAAASLALMGCYLWVSLIDGEAELSYAATNAVAYVAFAVAGWVTAGYLRRLGADADWFRDQAAAMAAKAEGDRHRLLLHDQATVLSLLSQEVTDPALLVALRHQAASGASRISSFLQGGTELTDVRTLGAHIRAAAEGFTDLPLTINVDLVDDLLVDQQVAATVRAAVATLLHNVRQHSGATSCVVHADTQPGSFEIVVRDNGVGFDLGTPARAAGPGTGSGFGLNRQVIDPLHEVGVHVEVATALGAGTTVTMTSSAAPAVVAGTDPGAHRGPRNTA